MRLPYGIAPGRGSEFEAGGVADLQTDVMRFMAILAICLVVIFALVQSIPLTSVQIVEPTPKPAPPPEPEPVPVPKPDFEPHPEPLAIPDPAPAAVETIAAIPDPEPVVATPAPAAAPEPPAPPVEQQGFTLQFESDLALTRLVARNEVGLYAIGPDKSLRMNVNRGRFSFWPASTPNQFHEMDPGTVPDDVQRALHMIQGTDAGAVKWGVTLPANMQQQLNGFLETAEHGAIYIAADGRLRLEP